MEEQTSEGRSKSRTGSVFFDERKLDASVSLEDMPHRTGDVDLQHTYISTLLLEPPRASF